MFESHYDNLVIDSQKKLDKNRHTAIFKKNFTEVNE